MLMSSAFLLYNSSQVTGMAGWVLYWFVCYSWSTKVAHCTTLGAPDTQFALEKVSSDVLRCGGVPGPQESLAMTLVRLAPTTGSAPAPFASAPWA